MFNGIMKTMKNMMNDDLLSMFAPGDGTSTKSELFSRIYQIQGLRDELEKILLLPKKKKQTWIKNYLPMLEDQMERHMYDSDAVLDGMVLDDDAKELAVEYIVALRDMVGVMQGIMREYKNLKG